MSAPDLASDTTPAAPPTARPVRPTPAGPIGNHRSCVACAQRKVRCDKRHPCARCQRAGVRCVLPPVSQRPRWARHLPPAASGHALTSPVPSTSTASTSPGTAVDQVLDRVKTLESLVHDLTAELERAHASPIASTTEPSRQPSGPFSTSLANVGTAVSQVLPTRRSRNTVQTGDLSSRFWSRIDHELGTLQESIPSHPNNDEPVAEGAELSKRQASVLQTDRAPLDRHAFLLRHAPSFRDHDPSSLFPMVSQVPYLLEVFTERIHFITGVPHLPSLKSVLQHRQSKPAQPTPPGEDALVFAVYYAAICSLDEDEVLASFNVSKDELSLTYRIGLEQSLARADFLNNPSDVVVQALLVFMTLARLNDTPKFFWMMTGIVIRMARYLGYHLDGSGIRHVTHFQAEMRRRIWWNLCALDLRATEDQGTELAISSSCHSTKLPSNINDADLWPEMQQAPHERREHTTVTVLRLCSKISRTTQEMIGAGTAATVEDHVQRLGDLAQELDDDYFGVTDASKHNVYLAAAGTMRVFLGRLTLLAFLPALFSAPDMAVSIELRTKLLVASIEIAEHNHALNCDPTCQPWKWVYRTQQYWHAVVYLLVEICRRQWSPIVERAWTALQSPWLVPAHVSVYQNPSVLVPLQRLTARARKHRGEEVVRLQSEPRAAAALEKEDRQQVPVPSSSTTFPAYFNDGTFYERWRLLVDSSGIESTDSSRGAGATDVRGETSRRFRAHVGNTTEAVLTPQTSQAPVTSNLYDIPRNVARNQDSDGPSLVADDSHRLLDIGADTDLSDSSDVVMGDSEFVNFDWNSWLESTRECL